MEVQEEREGGGLLEDRKGGKKTIMLCEIVEAAVLEAWI